MPFTFSHPAIVLPLLHKGRKYFSATGLIVGSMAPDFESVLWVRQYKVYSHTWWGMLWFDMPLALFLMFLFHVLLRDVLIDFLPGYFSQKFRYVKQFNFIEHFFRNIVKITYSTLIGIASHLMWDAFTHLNIHHPDSWKSEYSFMGHRVYILLQYSNSLLGLLVVLYVIHKLPSHPTNLAIPRKALYWLYVLLIAVLAAVIVITGFYPDVHFLNLIFVYILLFSFFMGITATSIIYKLKHWFTGSYL
ncbi:MAG: DUF4184 family protein [Chitinophagia bacterium]|nr:DUF4184 family protein [Chitinophagia bacterium]